MQANSAPTEDTTAPSTREDGVARRNALAALGLGAVGAAAFGPALGAAATQPGSVVSERVDDDTSHITLLAVAWLARRLYDVHKPDSWSVPTRRFLASEAAWGPCPGPGPGGAPGRPNPNPPCPGIPEFLRDLGLNAGNPDRPDIPTRGIPGGGPGRPGRPIR